MRSFTPIGAAHFSGDTAANTLDTLSRMLSLREKEATENTAERIAEKVHYSVHTLID